MFEAMACGIPIISAPWDDAEALFPEGTYLRVSNGGEMQQALRSLLADRELAATMAANARACVLAHHTCRHRAEQLLGIVNTMDRARQCATPAEFEGAAS